MLLFLQHRKTVIALTSVAIPKTNTQKNYVYLFAPIYLNYGIVMATYAVLEPIKSSYLIALALLLNQLCSLTSINNRQLTTGIATG